VLLAARWKYRAQKIAKNSPSGHHRTTLSGYIFATKVCIISWKKLDKQQYLPHVSLQYGELGLLAAEVVSLVCGTPANVNGFRVLAALLHGTSSGCQPNCGIEQRVPSICDRAAITFGIGPHF